MHPGMRRYQRPELAAASPRESEAVAFGLANAQLIRAMAPDSPPRLRIDALSKNHQMWSLICKDVTLDANGLPGELKQSIAGLARWAMAYSTAAMERELPLQPLIRVNQDMIDGLRTPAVGR
jgi:flagellar protein FlaF